jgi:hypothetical protein
VSCGDPRPVSERDERQAEQVAAELVNQMGELKARYRVERRLLESRSFENDKE